MPCIVYSPLDCPSYKPKSQHNFSQKSTTVQPCYEATFREQQLFVSSTQDKCIKIAGLWLTGSCNLHIFKKKKKKKPAVSRVPLAAIRFIQQGKEQFANSYNPDKPTRIISGLQSDCYGLRLCNAFDYLHWQTLGTIQDLYYSRFGNIMASAFQGNRSIRSIGKYFQKLCPQHCVKWLYGILPSTVKQPIDYTIFFPSIMGRRKEYCLISPINTVSVDGGISPAVLLCSASGELSLPAEHSDHYWQLAIAGKKKNLTGWLY